ncbi:hypothetical protein FOXG_13245 [Fusarium oxysporum f. sp. lycopersici 4287]|uniref:Major facilitator superfamily (MFS) profile domain-containing protein n=3 Tax=Fusarium oxysporum TaxID=5507 RepID=A0A0J9VUH3_FUSO4|nr:hypothetical protein FOXG_13245 [Fusarium oxysporum f. sp. lycopersici 4287]KNB14376.1 hypothetical protein FOXG_13245 [Fusarium oxysporum f. sp. lycopersici 4287]
MPVHEQQPMSRSLMSRSKHDCYHQSHVRARSRPFVAQGSASTFPVHPSRWISCVLFLPGDAQWRIPLAMKIPVPLILMFAIFSGPFSSRWQLFSMRYFHRTLMAAFIVSQSQLSGASVIQNFQNTFYAILGITGRQSLLVSGIYGFMGVIGTIIYLGIVADRWPRARTLWTGSLALSVSIAICMALSATYGQAGESNMAGARASITFIFIYSATFAIFFNTMIWVVPSELFPTFLRSKGMAFAVSSKSVVAIVLSQITPLALTEVSWRFYALFIACNTAASVLYFFFLPETGGKTLEEISELFGDAVAVDMHANIEKLDATSVVHAEGSEPRK